MAFVYIPFPFQWLVDERKGVRSDPLRGDSLLPTYSIIRLIHRKTRILISAALCCMLPFSGPSVWADSAGGSAVPQVSHAAAWSAPADSGWEIFFSRLSQQDWGPPLQITESGERNLVPSLVIAEDQSTWLFWVSQRGSDFQIHYARVERDDSFEIDTVQTVLTNNMAPTALFDPSGTLWLAWSAYDGTDEDIYYAVWEDSRWSPAIRVNQDDYTPDIQPVLGMDSNGEPWILWRGFSEGSYRFFVSRWSGEAWGPEELLTDDSSLLETIRMQFDAHPALPPEMQDPLKGSLFEWGAPVQSLPLFLRYPLAE